MLASIEKPAVVQDAQHPWGQLVSCIHTRITTKEVPLRSRQDSTLAWCYNFVSLKSVHLCPNINYVNIGKKLTYFVNDPGHTRIESSLDNWSILKNREISWNKWVHILSGPIITCIATILVVFITCTQIFPAYENELRVMWRKSTLFFNKHKLLTNCPLTTLPCNEQWYNFEKIYSKLDLSGLSDLSHLRLGYI